MNALAKIDDAALGSIELEQEVLGAALVTNSAFDAIERAVSADEFSEPLHSQLFETFAKAPDAHGIITPALVIASVGGDASVIVAEGTTLGQYVARIAAAASIPRNAAAYATPVVLLFLVTSLGGGLLYPDYRVEVRPALEDLQLRAANGIFEIKEHLVAVGLGALPGYWFFWRTPLAPEHGSTRRYLTWLLAFLVWWAFLTGHVLNNIKGLSL